MYLAEKGKKQARHYLAKLLWPDTDKKQGLGNLRSMLNRLKGSDLGAYLQIERNHIGLQNTHIKFDLNDLRSISSQIQQSSTDELLLLFDTYKGAFLSDINLENLSELNNWGFTVQHEIETILYQAYLFLTPNLIRENRAKNAITYGKIISEIFPYDDRIQFLHIQSFIANGQISLALNKLNDYRSQILEQHPDHQFIQDLLDLGAKLAKPEELATHLLSLNQSYVFRPVEPRTLHKQGNAIQFIIPEKEVIGREREASQLQKLLMQKQRLISIVGIGGIGKTVFTRSQIPSLIDHFGHSVYFINISFGKNQEFIARKRAGSSILINIIAKTIFVEQQDTVSVEALIKSLSDTPLCLIIDNFESILSEAKYLTELLDRLPDLTILITSRYQLNLFKENIIHLKGLRLDNESNKKHAYGPAIQLFEKAAQRQLPDFSLNQENLETITELCGELGGLPLAIELLAKQLDLFTLDELISESTDITLLLKDNSADLSLQHQDVLKILENMWQRLSDEAKQVLPELARFKSKWSKKAMRLAAPAELNTYRELLQASMLQKTSSGHFKLHPLIKKFASDQQSNHFEHLLFLERDQKFDFPFPSAKKLEDSLSVINQEDAEVRYHLLMGLITTKEFFQEDLHELAEVSLELIALATQLGDHIKLIHAHLICAKCKDTIGQEIQGLEHLEIALELCRAVHYTKGEVFILYQMAHMLSIISYFDKALEKSQLCHDLLDQVDTPPAFKLKLGEITAFAHWGLGNANAAIKICNEIVEACRKQGLAYQMVATMETLAGVLHTLNNDAEIGLEIAEDALKITKNFNGSRYRMRCLYRIGIIQNFLGLYEEAEQNLIIVRNEKSKLGQSTFVAHTQEILGRVYFNLGEYEKSKVHTLEALKQRAEAHLNIGEAWCWMSYGELLATISNYDKAIEAYLKSCDLINRSSNSEVPILTARSFSGLAWSYCSLHQLTKAKEYADKAWEFILENEFNANWSWGEACLDLIDTFTHLEDDRANDVLAKAYDGVQRIATKMKKKHIKNSFLNNVRSNREICNLYEQRLGTKDSSEHYGRRS